jgi:ABC-type lipoprotein export system ATPase subunit
MITHNPDNAALADRTLHIRDGALLDDPASPRKGAVRRQTATKTVVR